MILLPTSHQIQSDEDNMVAVPFIPEKKQSEIELENFMKVVSWMWDTNC